MLHRTSANILVNELFSRSGPINTQFPCQWDMHMTVRARIAFLYNQIERDDTSRKRAEANTVAKLCDPAQ